MAAGTNAVAVDLAGEGEVEVLRSVEIAEAVEAAPLAQAQVGMALAVLLVNVPVGGEHEGEGRRHQAGLDFPREVVVAVPGDGRRVAASLPHRLPDLLSLLAGGLVEDGVVRAAALHLRQELLGHDSGAGLLPGQEVIEVIDFVTESAQRLGEGDVHRLDGVRRAVVAARNAGKDLHPSLRQYEPVGSMGTMADLMPWPAR